jgi:hypothetical protein
LEFRADALWCEFQQLQLGFFVIDRARRNDMTSWLFRNAGRR